MFAALPKDTAPFHAIISNPPYVAQHEMSGLEAELDFEPQNALSDGQDGLSFLRQLVEQAVDWLYTNGLLVVETGVCGLPDDAQGMHLQQRIIDLAGHLRGGIYRAD